MAEHDPFYTEPGEEWTGSDLTRPGQDEMQDIQAPGSTGTGMTSHTERLGISGKLKDPNALKRYVMRPSYIRDPTSSGAEHEKFRLERMTRKMLEGNIPAGIIAQANQSSEQPSN